MERYQINSGIIINFLEQNIIMKNIMNVSIIQFKISCNKITLKFQKNGNMIILLMIKIILKQCYKLEMDKFQINNISMILAYKTYTVKLLQ